MLKPAIVCKPELAALAEQVLAARPGEVLQVEQTLLQAMETGGWVQIYLREHEPFVSARVCDPYKW